MFEQDCRSPRGDTVGLGSECVEKRHQSVPLVCRTYARRIALEEPDNRASVSSADQRHTLVPLLNAFGTQAYSVSPRGAAVLLERCLPLGRRVVSFEEPGVTFWEEGVDGAMNIAYPKMRSYVCLPPLALHAPPATSPSDRLGRDIA